MNAIILAGGRGSRLAPWHAPKALLPISGVPIISRLLRHLYSATERMIVCTGYRADDIERALSTWSTKVRCSDAGEDAPMGARLLKARELTDGGRVLICYGDELADVDIAGLVAQHERDRRLVTFAACKQRVTGGVVYEEYDNVRIRDDWHELVNIGFAVVEPQCWQLLEPQHGLSDWINAVDMSRISVEVVGEAPVATFRRQLVGVYRHLGKRATINSLADLKAAEEIWK